MSHITLKDCIVITSTAVTVNGKETTEFLGQDIYQAETLPRDFAKIQAKTYKEFGVQPIEMRVLTSKTNGHQGVLGEPSCKHGKHAWSLFVFENDIKTRCLYQVSHDSTAICAGWGAAYCVEEILGSYVLRRTLVYSAATKLLKQQSNPTLGLLLLTFRPLIWDGKMTTKR